MARLPVWMRFSKDPDYYYNKRLRLEKKMMKTVVVTQPQPEHTESVIKEKKKPGRKKKIPAPKNPIMREEREVVLRWD